MTRARAVVAVSVSLSVLALGACSGEDPEPRFAPPSSSAPTSPSTTAASGPTEPTMPAEARGTDAAAAEAFVRFYWEMADYAQATGDLDGLEEISPSGCKPCRRVIGFLRSVERRGGKIHGGETEVSSLSSAPIGDRGRLRVVRFDLTNSRQTVDFDGTADDEEYPAGTVAVEAVVRSSSDGWVLEYWDKR